MSRPFEHRVQDIRIRGYSLDKVISNFSTYTDIHIELVIEGPQGQVELGITNLSGIFSGSENFEEFNLDAPSVSRIQNTVKNTMLLQEAVCGQEEAFEELGTFWKDIENEIAQSIQDDINQIDVIG